MKLGSWLIAKGKISGVQLKRALLDQSFFGSYLSSSLMKLGYMDEGTLGEYLTETFKVPYAASHLFAELSPEVLRVVPQAIAAKHLVVPLAVVGRKLQLALLNPRNLLVLDEVSFLTGLQAEAWVASESILRDALEKYYQVPRPTRQTIPLADGVEEEVPEGSATPAPPAFSPAVAPAATPGREEIGLDGRPLSAPAELTETQQILPSLSDTPGASSAPPPRHTPRSIAEWRSQESQASEPTSMPRETAPIPGAAEPPPLGKPQPAHPTLTLVPPPPPDSLEEATERLKNSLSRDEVFEALVGFCAARFVRTALFVVMQEKVIGWGGRGDGFEPARIRATSIPFSTPSIFSYFRMGSDFYFGPVPELPANQQFYRELSVPFPDRALLVPIQIKGRLIALLYGDNGTGRREEPDIALFRRLAQKASLALEILILRNKIDMV